MDSNDPNQYLQPKQKGTVHFTTDPSGAQIFVDGQIVTDLATGESKRTPATVQLFEGRRDFVLSLEGYRDEIGYVDVLANTTVSINRNLKSGKSEGGWGTPEPQISLQNPNQTESTCTEFARILGAEIVTSRPDMCVTSRMRNINVTVHDRPSNSPLTLASMSSYESSDNEEKCLCLGETVLLGEEIEPFILFLRKVNVEITAIHNHWLFTDPPLFYAHWMSIEHPLTYAMKIGNIFTTMK